MAGIAARGVMARVTVHREIVLNADARLAALSRSGIKALRVTGCTLRSCILTVVAGQARVHLLRIDDLSSRRVDRMTVGTLRALRQEVFMANANSCRIVSERFCISVLMTARARLRAYSAVR